MMTPIAATLFNAIGTQPTGWESLTQAVSAAHKIPKKGWMRVRGDLQGLINAGLVARVDDENDELYVRV